MNVKKLEASLTKLTRIEKMRIVQHLIEELVNDETATERRNAAYPIWTPVQSYSAAAGLEKLLYDETKKKYAKA